MASQSQTKYNHGNQFKKVPGTAAFRTYFSA